MATITGRQIRDETVESVDIKDGAVTSDDINTTDASKSLPTRIIAGDNITISETGGRTGAGDVTVNASTVTALDGGSSSSTYDSGDMDGGGA